LGVETAMSNHTGEAGYSGYKALSCCTPSVISIGISWERPPSNSQCQLC